MKCPAGGNHEYSASWDYTLSNFADDKTYLVGGGWFAGQTFIDNARNVKIHVESTDSAAGIASVTLGQAI